MSDETARMNTYRQMTEAPVERLVCKMAVPTTVSMLVTSFYSLADTFYVGKLGTSATGAIGIVFSLMSIIQAVGFFFGQGSGNYISRKLGERNSEEAAKMAATGFFSAFAIVSVLAAIGLVFLTPLVSVLGATETIQPYAEVYAKYILIAAPFMCTSLVLNNQLRLQGNAMSAMVGITAGAVLNVALAPLFIFVFKMGIAGAAIATMICQIISFILLLAGCTREGAIRIKLKNFRFRLQLFSEIARCGTPPLCRQGLASIAAIALNVSVRPYGDAAVAAISIVNRVIMLATATLLGFGQGFQPVCGFNYGAKRFDRVLKAFWFCVKVSAVFLTFLSVLGFIFAPVIVETFRKGDPQVVAIGAYALRLQCISFPLWSWIILSNMLTQNIGEFKKASLISLSRQGLCFLPLIFILPKYFGLTGALISQPIADAATFIIASFLTVSVVKRLNSSKELSEN